MSTDTSSFTISIFSKSTGLLAGGVAAALVGGYLALGSVAPMSAGTPFAAAEAGATGADVINRRGLRSGYTAAGTSFETGEPAVLATYEERITRRGLRTVPVASGPFSGPDQSAEQVAVLIVEDTTITRRGNR